MFLLNSTYDYPYYISKDRIFFDYLEALKNCDSKKEVNDIKMYAWDNELSRIKWWEEPPLSLAYYFKERAQQLRDKYSYIRLFVSGGYDSYYALRSFIDNDIFLDEIVHSRSDFSQTNDYWADIEYYEQFLKIIETHKQSLEKTKITVLEPEYRKIFMEEKNIYEYSDHPSCLTNSPKFIFNSTNLSFNKAINIWSQPKAEISIIDGKLYFNFKSFEFMAPTENIECFYISKDNFNLYLKQIHLIKNYVKLNNITTIDRLNMVPLATGNPYFNDHQSKNYANITMSTNAKFRLFPLLRGKNYFRIQALRKHNETNKIYSIWKDYLKSVYQNTYHLNLSRAHIQGTTSQSYSLDSNKKFYIFD